MLVIVAVVLVPLVMRLLMVEGTAILAVPVIVASLTVVSLKSHLDRIIVVTLFVVSLLVLDDDGFLVVPHVLCLVMDHFVSPWLLVVNRLMVTVLMDGLCVVDWLVSSFMVSFLLVGVPFVVDGLARLVLVVLLMDQLDWLLNVMVLVVARSIVAVVVDNFDGDFLVVASLVMDDLHGSLHVVVAVRVMRMMNPARVVDLPVVVTVVVLHIVMVDIDIAMVTHVVIIVMLDVLLVVVTDQVLLTMVVVLAVEMRVDEGIMNRRDLDAVLLLLGLMVDEEIGRAHV